MLFGVGSAIWALDMPEDGSAVIDVIDFYRDTADRIVVGGTAQPARLSPRSCGSRPRLAVSSPTREGNDVLATTAFAGGLLSMAAGIGAESINMAAALRAQDDELSDELAQSLFETSQGSSARRADCRRTRSARAGHRGGRAPEAGLVLPRILAIAFVVLGVVLLSPLSHVNWVAGAALVLLAALDRRRRALSGRLHERLEARVILAARRTSHEMGACMPGTSRSASDPAISRST